MSGCDASAGIGQNTPTLGTRHLLVIMATLLLVASCFWTLQAFIPEPYFLRTVRQLRIMSTPNGFGQIECSLAPFYGTIVFELLGLAALAVWAWRSRTVIIALCYLFAILGMASITLYRLHSAMTGPW